MNAKGVFFWVMTVLLPWSLQANPRQDLQQGNQAYQDGRFAEAIAYYESVLEAGYESVALYHNLGNTWYRLEQPGKAALYYHRGLALAPVDAGLKENLAVIRAGFEEPITPLPAFFLERWWRQWQRALGPNGWSIVGLLLLWGGCWGLWRWRSAAQRTQRKRAFVLGIAALLLATLPFTLAFTGAAAQQTGQAVVVEGPVRLLEAADARSPLVRTLPAGTSLEMLDQIGDWVKVRLVNGDVGWVMTGSFERL